MRNFWLLIILFCIKLNAQSFNCKDFTDIPAMEKASFKSKYFAKVKSQASANYSIYYSRFFCKVDPAVRYINGKVVHYFNIQNSTNNIVLDFTDKLLVDSIIFRQQKTSFQQQSNQTITVNFNSTLISNQKDSLIFYYHGEPDNTGFGSFIQSTHNSNPVIWTLSEPYGAKDWFPCRSGLDDKTDSIDIFITHPTQYKATANGLLQYELNDGINKTVFYKHRYPIASYLIAFSVTNFSVFNHSVQLGNVSLPMISHIYPEDSTNFSNNTYKVLDAMKLFHNTFGPYPFIKEKYGHTQFGWGGGMEHQTNTFLVVPDNNLMAHELGHQWFGDKITCGSWQHIWLNESFATFAANYYLEKFDTARFRSILNTHLNNVVSLNDGSVFCKDTTDPNRIFNGRLSYDKGGYVLRMLRFTIGDSLFFKTLQTYLADTSLQYNFAYTNDFKRVLENVTGKDFTYFFNQWIYGEGHPTFNVTWSLNKNNWAKVKVNETTSHSSVSFFKTPLPLTFKNATQQKTIVIQCNENNAETWVDVGFEADTVLIDIDKQLINKNNTAQKITNGYLLIDEIKVYPNPASKNLFINIKNPSSKTLIAILYNSTGQKIYTKTFSTLGADETLQIINQPLAKGVYTLSIDNTVGLKLAKKIFIN